MKFKKSKNDLPDDLKLKLHLNQKKTLKDKICINILNNPHYINNDIVVDDNINIPLKKLNMKILKVQKSLKIYQLSILFTLILSVGSYLNKIELKINKHGANIQIYRSEIETCPADRAPKPNEVYINNINQSKIMTSYFLNDSESNITLIWKSRITSAACMFKGCDNIIEIDLSSFDSSRVNDMYQMFYSCDGLESINLSNLDTSKVTRMGSMFAFCYKLQSLNLSNFNTQIVRNMHGMFSCCYEMKYLDVSGLDTSNVLSMSSMFYGCKNLTSLDLSHFNTSSSESFQSMFDGCTKLISLNLSSFETSKVVNMEYMFRGCLSLISLNLSNFDTSNVGRMSFMFKGCSKLRDLNISSFNVSKVIIMENMFEYCSSLTSLNLSSFNTVNNKYMHSMFNGCSSLVSLDLSNFDTHLIADMGSVFKDCSKLKFLNLSNFNTEKFSNLSYIFSGCSELVSLDLSNFNDTNFKNERNLKNMFSNCDSLKYINLENSDLTKEMVINVFKDLLYSYDEIIICGINDLIIFNASKIFINCIINDSNLVKYKNCYIKNSNKINNIKNICDICGNIYYKKHHDINNNDSNINCYIKPNDSYFENINCYETCKSCDIEGNENSHNCVECNDNFTPEHNNLNYLNCKCDNFYYKDIYINKTFCTENKICPTSQAKLIINKNECIDNCTRDNVYKYELDSICYDENTYNQLINEYTTELIVTDELSEKITGLITEKIIGSITDKITEKIKIFNSLSYISTDLMPNNIINHTDNLSSTIKPPYFNNSIDFSRYNNTLNLSDYITLRKYLIGNYNNINIINSRYKLNNLLIILSTTEKEKNNINKENIKTAINLSECENILRLKNNIPINESLYIFKLEVEEEGMKIPKVEYEVYFPFKSDKLILLNLSVCENTKIDIYIKVNINDKDLEKYNSSSAYYQDFCTKITSDFGTDISLLDRKNNFIENNMTLCEENCDLIDYNYTTKKAKCSCLVKIKIPFINDIKFDKSKLLKNFIDYKNFLNFKFLKCYKQVFKIRSLKKNYGFYIYTFLYLFYFLTLFLFSGKYYNNLILEANKIIFSKNKIIELETKHSRRLSSTKDKILNNNKKNNINKKRKRNIISSISNPTNNKNKKKVLKRV